MGLHRDLLNLKGHMNHAITLGSFSGGRVWVEDENGSFPAEVKLRTKTRSLMGTWHDIHDKPITFDARRFHQVEQHEGHMSALAAYIPQAFRWISDENVEILLSLNFPCQNAKTKLEAKRLQISSRTENEKQAALLLAAPQAAVDIFLFFGRICRGRLRSSFQNAGRASGDAFFAARGAVCGPIVHQLWANSVPPEGT